MYKICEEEMHDHEKENRLTHDLMQLKGNKWWTVRGGSSTSMSMERKKPCYERREIETCYCHLPRAEKVRKDGVKYYRCARYDCKWMREYVEDIGYNIPKPCTYFSYE